MREVAIVRNYYLQKQNEQNEPAQPTTRSLAIDRLPATRSKKVRIVDQDTLYTLLK